MDLPECMYDYRYERTSEDKQVPCNKCDEPITYNNAYESLEDESYICYLCHLKEVENKDDNKCFD